MFNFLACVFPVTLLLRRLSLALAGVHFWALCYNSMVLGGDVKVVGEPLRLSFWCACVKLRLRLEGMKTISFKKNVYGYKNQVKIDSLSRLPSKGQNFPRILKETGFDRVPNVTSLGSIISKFSWRESDANLDCYGPCNKQWEGACKALKVKTSFCVPHQ